ARFRIARSTGVRVRNGPVPILDGALLVDIEEIHMSERLDELWRVGSKRPRGDGLRAPNRRCTADARGPGSGSARQNRGRLESSVAIPVDDLRIAAGC